MDEFRDEFRSERSPFLERALSRRNKRARSQLAAILKEILKVCGGPRARAAARKRISMRGSITRVPMRRTR